MGLDTDNSSVIRFQFIPSILWVFEIFDALFSCGRSVINSCCEFEAHSHKFIEAVVNKLIMNHLVEHTFSRELIWQTSRGSQCKVVKASVEKKQSIPDHFYDCMYNWQQTRSSISNIRATKWRWLTFSPTASKLCKYRSIVL